MSKNLLIISAEFPPMPVVGAVRVAKLAKAFVEEGWRVDVVTADPATWAPRLPKPSPMETGATVHHVPYLDPYAALVRLRRRVARAAAGVNGVPGEPASTGGEGRSGFWRRAVLAGVAATWAPDAFAAWVRPASRCALALASKRRPDLILSSFPLASSHLAAMRVAERLRVPWVADFRDAYTGASYAKYAGLTRVAARVTERKVMERASLVSAVSAPILELLRPAPQGATLVLPQGADMPWLSLGAPPSPPRGDRLRIVHLGTTGRALADPVVVLDALAKIDPSIRADIELCFIGTSLDVDLRREVTMRGLENVVRVEAFRPRAEALTATEEAHGGLLLRTRAGKDFLPGKLWDYFALGKPVLAVVDPASSAAEVIRRTRMGDIAAFDDPTEVAQLITKWIEAWRAGSLRVAPDVAALAAYDPRSCVRELTRTLGLGGASA